MGTNLEGIVKDEALRQEQFPVASRRVFMAHAGVSPLPKAAVDVMDRFLEQASGDHQESGFVPGLIVEARAEAARLVGCGASEVSLLGPTSLGLSLVAGGISWQRGDEVICYPDDYPANVYPWRRLEKKGVQVVLLEPDGPGRITWDLVEAALSGKTRLVALATAHYLSGYRIDVDTIGRNLRERGVLFCLDGIQTAGAFPLSMKYVDFMSADSHKWMLGPLGAGIFYVRQERAAELEPLLVGSWNVRSPDFIAQEGIEYEEGGRRFEPGALNIPGIAGMTGSLKLLNRIGIDAIAERILKLRAIIERGARQLGYVPLSAVDDGDECRSGILSIRRPGTDGPAMYRRLAAQGISVSLRHNRDGKEYIRISPHFYNTEEEAGRVCQALDGTA